MTVLSVKFSGSYSEPQWRAIAKAVSVGLSLDADRTTLPGDQHFYRVPCCDVDPPAGLTLRGVMLRTKLQRLVTFALADRHAPFQSLAGLRRLQVQTDKLRQAFIDHSRPHWCEELREAPSKLAKFSRGLAHEMDKIPKGRARLNAYDARRSHLIADLLALWIKLGGRPAGKATDSFMQACLEPIFGRTSATTAKGIARWLERYRSGEIFFHY
jgi:hypothetical protein